MKMYTNFKTGLSIESIRKKGEVNIVITHKDRAKLFEVERAVFILIQLIGKQEKEKK